MNKVILIGRLGKDPEVAYLPTGTAVATFSLATRGYKKDITDWHNLKAFGKTAELCREYLVKGNQAGFEGRLQTSSWEKDGVKHYKTEVIIDSVEFLEKTEVKPDPQNYRKEERPTVSDKDDSIPF